MICPSCGTRNNYYHKFCYNCGKQLVDEPEPVQPEQNKENEFEDNVEDNSDAVKNIDDTLLNTDEIVSESVQNADDTVEASDFSPEENDGMFDIGSDFEAFTDESFISEFDGDLDETLPLRRYQNPNRKGGGFFKKLLTGIAYLIMAFALTVLVYIAYTRLLQPQSPSSKLGAEDIIDYIANYESVVFEDQPATKITIYTIKGERVKILDKIVSVKDGKAEVIFKDNELYNLEGNEKTDNGVNVTLDVALSADGYFTREEKLTFPVAVPYAPLKVISPSELEAIIDGSNYNLILEVNPGSEVTVNDESYSHMVDKDGVLSINLDVPTDTINTYKIKVSAPGFVDHEQDVVLKRQDFGFPLIVDQKSPIKAEGDTVTITGTTDPKATFKTNLELAGDPEIDSETGEFTLAAKVSGKGLIPLDITASLEGFDDAVLNLVIEKEISEGEYTRTAWAPDYNQLKNRPDHLNGTIFLVEGTIKNIISSGEKNIFIVNGAGGGSEEQLYYIIYWGSFKFTEGDKVRAFGNRWNNHDGMPKILAKYLY